MSILYFVGILVFALAVIGLLSSAPFMGQLNPNIRWGILATLGIVLLAYVLNFFGLLPAGVYRMNR